MNRLHLSDDALNDLVEMKDYIEQELSNPDAATNTVAGIMKHLRILKDHSASGAPLSAITNTESDYRYLICGNYLAFYRAEDVDVYIDRILYKKRDYVSVLFNDNSEEE